MNGAVIEELMDERGTVCLNDARETRLNSVCVGPDVGFYPTGWSV